MGWTFFLLLLLLILVLPLVMVYGVTRRQFGQETARKNSLVLFICILVGTGLVVGLRFLPGHRGEGLLTIFLLVVSLAACDGQRSRRFFSGFCPCFEFEITAR
jgi:hypothetical protein